MSKLTAEDILGTIRLSFDRARREALEAAGILDSDEKVAAERNWTHVWMRSAFEQMVRANKAEAKLAALRKKQRHLIPDPTPQLRIRVTEDTRASSRPRRIEVLDVDGNVLGDLANSVGGCSWKMGVGDIGTITLEIAVERAAIDSIEVKGMNTR